MEIAPVADDGAVGESSARGELGALARSAVEMSTDPWFPLTQEPLDPVLGVAPAATVGRRERDDEAQLRIDRDPEVARPRRVAQRVAARRAAQRARPSRSVATAFSIRRRRVSSAFAASMGSTQNRW